MHLLLFFFMVINQSNGVNIHEADKVEFYINKLIKEFEEKPEDAKFSSVIHPPLPRAGSSKAEFFLPKVFLWSPQEHFGIEMRCPLHQNTLHPAGWTNTVSGNKNPARLVYDLHGNVILVQRIYLCVNGKNRHKLRPTSCDVQNGLPLTIQAFFPAELFQRSGCTKYLLQYIETQILQGVNFLKISEGLASLNFQHFCRQRNIFLTAVKEYKSLAGSSSSCSEFYSNVLYSFPSNDQIMNLFLNAFRRKKHLYESEMNSLSANALSCDHTFKISRNVGLVREGDNKFVTQFNQLYIALNERGEVLSWRLTRGTSFAEIEDLLLDLKRRLDKDGLTLYNIYVDDCCRVRNKYNNVFPDAEVKLDLFHACQRIVKTLPISNSLHKDAAKDFVQIFRQNDDQDLVRSKCTPKKEEIERNLNVFIERWINIPINPLTTSTMAEIKNLRNHIHKGCLSDIAPGCGTERNEQLHRLLNRSLITGATRISTELAVALLTILFYYHNKKMSSYCTHSCNKRVKPVVPIEAMDESGVTLQSQNEKMCFHIKKIDEYNININPQCSLNVTTDEGPFIVMPETVVDVCTETVACAVLNAAYNLQEMVENIQKQSCNRSFNALDMIHLSKMSNVLVVDEYSEYEDPTIQSHSLSLERQLAGFGLQIDPVQRDGDCAFRSVVRQLQRRAEYDTVIANHLDSKKLSEDEDSATFTLRQLFVHEMVDEGSESRNFLSGTTEEITEKANEFRQEGVFDREIGDFVIKVCSNILKIPIMVITSNQSVPFVPFFPDDVISNEAIYVAYHYYGAGHYDATKLVNGDVKAQQTKPTASKSNGCYCGRKATSSNETCCIVSSNTGKSRCPCVSNGKSCISNCKCGLKCANRKDTNALISCRCGEHNYRKGDKDTSSCSDTLGKRRTKCPCYGRKKPCTNQCSCRGCNNEYGNNVYTSSPEKRSQKCTSSPFSLKRKRSSQYLSENGFGIKQGPWTVQETCILESVQSFLLSTCIMPTEENATILFNFVVNSQIATSMKINAKSKTEAQVRGKINYDNNRQENLKKEFYGVNMNLFH